MNDTDLTYIPVASTPQEYFDDVHSEFRRAQSAFGGSNSYFYKIGEYTVKLTFAGPALVPYFTPAFEHLTAKPVPDPNLTVCIWDSYSTRSKSISPPIRAEDHHPLGQVRGTIGEHLIIDYDLETNCLNLLDIHQGLGIYWVQNSNKHSPAETAAPLRNIIFWWSRRHGYQFLHAGAIGTPNGSAVVVGKSGSGKSTTTMACLFSGMLFLGDDNILVDAKSVPTAYSLYNSAKMDPDLYQRLSAVIPTHIKPDNASVDKWIYFLQTYFPENLPKSLPVKAIVYPKISGLGTTKVAPASPGMILKALAPSSIVPFSGAGSSDFQAIASFIKRVPCYTLELGNDLQKSPFLIQQLLDR